MSPEYLSRIILLGIAHWVLAGFLLSDLACRARVAGGRKALWAVLIIFVTLFGSLLYLIFHPQVLNPDYHHRDPRNKP